MLGYFLVKASSVLALARAKREPVLERIVADRVGFDLAETGYGTGLQGIADRLGALDGSLRVRSVPGAGTTITGTVPI